MKKTGKIISFVFLVCVVVGILSTIHHGKEVTNLFAGVGYVAVIIGLLYALYYFLFKKSKKTQRVPKVKKAIKRKNHSFTVIQGGKKR